MKKMYFVSFMMTFICSILVFLAVFHFAGIPYSVVKKMIVKEEEVF